MSLSLSCGGEIWGWIDPCKAFQARPLVETSVKTSIDFDLLLFQYHRRHIVPIIL
jgi:hypothetical protein